MLPNSGVIIGSRVTIKGEAGTVKYAGTTSFADGFWVGVELDKPLGKHRGSVDGVTYFECSAPSGLYGLFVRETLAVPIEEEIKDVSKVVDKLLSKLFAAQKEISALKDRISQYSNVESQFEMLSAENQFLTDSAVEKQQLLDQLRVEYDCLVADHKACLEELAIHAEMELEAKLLLQTNDNSPENIAILLLSNQVLQKSLLVAKSRQKENEEAYGNLLSSLNELRSTRDSSLDAIRDLQGQLDSSRQTILLLQEQIDAMEDSDRIFSHLSQENTDLNQEILELKQLMADLTELHQLDQSLEESQRHVERELRQNVTHLQTIVEKDKSRLQQLEKKIHEKASELTTPINNKTQQYVKSDALKQQIEELKIQVRALESQLSRYKIGALVAQAKTDYAFNCEKLSRAFSEHEETIHIIFRVQLLSKHLKALCCSVGPSDELFPALQLGQRVLELFYILLEANINLPSWKLLIPDLVLLVKDMNSKVDGTIQGFAQEGFLQFTQDSRLMEFIFNAIAANRDTKLAGRTIRALFSAWAANYAQEMHFILTPIIDFQHLLEPCRRTSLVSLMTASTELVSISTVEYDRISMLEPTLDTVDHDVSEVADLMRCDLSNLKEFCVTLSAYGALEANADENGIKKLLDQETENLTKMKLLCSHQLNTHKVEYTSLQDYLLQHVSKTKENPPLNDTYVKQLVAKDRMIQDLRLNVEFLETMMDSRQTRFDDQVTKLESSLGETLQEYRLVQKNLVQLKLENSTLSSRLAYLESGIEEGTASHKSSVTLDYAIMHAKYSNLVNEVNDLKRLAWHALQFLKPITAKLNPLPVAKLPRTPVAGQLLLCGTLLRRLATSVSPLEVSLDIDSKIVQESLQKSTHLYALHEITKYHRNRDNCLQALTCVFQS